MAEITLEAISQMLDEKLDKRLAESEQRSTNNMMVLIESHITPRFNLLAEEIQTVRELLVPRSRVDDLEEEVKFLKAIIRQINEDVQELKKAQ